MIKNFQKGLVASSLIEITISLVILMLAFSITITIFINVTNSAISIQKLKSNLIAIDKAEETIRKKNFLNENLLLEEFYLVKSVKKFNNNDHLILLEINILNLNKELQYQFKQVVYVQ